MEDRSLAFLMALHTRLGRCSLLRLLDDNSLSLVCYVQSGMPALFCTVAVISVRVA